jgi:hypothetical protein
MGVHFLICNHMKIPCPNCKELAFSKWGKLHIGILKNIRCSKCNAEVTIPTSKLILFSICSQLLGSIVFIVILSLLLGKVPIIMVIAVSILGYIIVLLPVIYLYVNKVELITKKCMTSGARSS